MLGFTPLHRIVAKEGTWEAAGELLNAGADRYAIADDGKFPHDMVPDGPLGGNETFFDPFLHVVTGVIALSHLRYNS